MSYVVGEELRRLRTLLGETQRQFYGRLHLTRQAGSSYERNVTPVPYDIACHMVRTLKPARLAVKMMGQSGVNVMPIPWFDRIDHHPMAVVSKVHEEMREGADAAMSKVALLVNHNDRTDFTDDDWATFEDLMQEVIDVYVAALILFVMANERFGWNPWAAAERAYKKYRSRGYISYTPERATAAVGGD